MKERPTMEEGEQKLTPLQFAKRYAEKSGVDFQFLADHGYVVLPCDPDCDWPTCKGWIMESENYINNCIQGNIPLPDEMYYLRDMES